MGFRRWLFIAAFSLLGCGGTTSSTQAKWVDRPNVQKLKEVPRAIDQAKTEATKPTPSPVDREPVTEGIPIEGSQLVQGRSTVVVDAPLDKVKATVLRYDDYAEFMPHYTSSKIVGKHGAAHEVYMQVEALHGAVRMWARLQMTPKKEGPVHLFQSKFLEGNVKDFRATWRVEPIDAEHTKLTLDVFLNPTLPLPKKVIDGENTKGAEKGVLAMRSRIEKGE